MLVCRTIRSARFHRLHVTSLCLRPGREMAQKHGGEMATEFLVGSRGEVGRAVGHLAQPLCPRASVLGVDGGCSIRVSAGPFARPAGRPRTNVAIRQDDVDGGRVCCMRSARRVVACAGARVRDCVVRVHSRSVRRSGICSRRGSVCRWATRHARVSLVGWRGPRKNHAGQCGRKKSEKVILRQHAGPRGPA